MKFLNKYESEFFYFLSDTFGQDTKVIYMLSR